MLTKAPASLARFASSGPVSFSVGLSKLRGSPTARICHSTPRGVIGACNSAPIIVVKSLFLNFRVSVIG